MYEWANQANCSGMPVQVFSLAEIGDPDVSHIDGRDPGHYKKLRRFNEKKVARAVEHCRGCPVWFECLESATTDDRTFTVRGGMAPYGMEEGAAKEASAARLRSNANLNLGLTPEQVASNREAARLAREEKILNPCAKCGGKSWKEYRDDAGSLERIDCRNCRNIRAAKYRKRDTEDKGKVYKPRKGSLPRETCPEGHDDWYNFASGRRCKPCHKANTKRAKEAGKVEG